MSEDRQGAEASEPVDPLTHSSILATGVYAVGAVQWLLVVGYVAAMRDGLFSLSLEAVAANLLIFGIISLSAVAVRNIWINLLILIAGLPYSTILLNGLDGEAGLVAI